MKIQSKAFREGELIPLKYTCEGQNCNPPLEFTEIPEAAQSLALLVEDPDSPAVKPWVHWVVFNIIPTATWLEENVKNGNFLEGVGTNNIYGYQGPCPPSGIHRYQFKLYALNTMLNISHEIDRKALLKEMEGKVIESAMLTGLYEKQAVKQKSI